MKIASPNAELDLFGNSRPQFYQSFAEAFKPNQALASFINAFRTRSRSASFIASTATVTRPTAVLPWMKRALT